MLSPRRIGPYTLLGRIAFGSMSEVLLAERPEAPGQRFALKLLLPHLADSEEHARLFRDEAELGARLDHPNIARVMDHGEVDGRAYFVMEHVRGPNLASLAETRSSPLPVDLVLGIGRACAAALDFAHRAGVIHHDVNPENILLGADGAVKLIDFGVARGAGEGDGALRGKVAYSAPEALAAGEVDARADVFSLGVVLHELVTGARLFLRDSQPLTLLAVADAPIPRVSTLRSDVPAALDDALARALERDLERRWASAAELGEALGRCAALRFRPATTDDAAYLEALNRRAYRELAERHYGDWDDAAQCEKLRRKLEEGSFRLVELDGEVVGALWTLERDDGFVLRDLMIEPERQRRGLGSRVLALETARADAARKPMRLHTLVSNPARRLYERYGFAETRRDDHFVDMERPVGGEDSARDCSGLPRTRAPANGC